MKKLLFIIMAVFLFTTVEAGPFSTQPKTKHCSANYCKKQTKKSLKFAKVHNRKVNRKGLTR